MKESATEMLIMADSARLDLWTKLILGKAVIKIIRPVIATLSRVDGE